MLCRDDGLTAKARRVLHPGGGHPRQPPDQRRQRPQKYRGAAVVVSALLTVSGAAVVADHEFGTTQPQVVLGSTGLPPAAAAATSPDLGPGTPPGASAAPVVSPDLGPGTPPGASAAPVVDRSGTPVELLIPFASSHHPQGVTARITADPLNPNGSLFVPPDPRVLSWGSQDAAPGSARGTAIVTGHINYNIDGTLIEGGLADLAEYAINNIGQTFTVVLADQRRLTYQISGGAEYNKDQLATNPQLRGKLYDQDGTFGPPGTAPSGRLLLVSCGGAYDNATGNYQDNVFLYALPVN